MYSGEEEFNLWRNDNRLGDENKGYGHVERIKDTSEFKTCRTSKVKNELQEDRQGREGTKDPRTVRHDTLTRSSMVPGPGHVYNLKKVI